METPVATSKTVKNPTASTKFGHTYEGCKYRKNPQRFGPNVTGGDRNVDIAIEGLAYANSVAAPRVANETYHRASTKDGHDKNHCLFVRPHWRNHLEHRLTAIKRDRIAYFDRKEKG